MATGAAGAGGDYSVIGWLFEAKDEASPVVAKIEELIEVAVAAVRQHLEAATDTVDDTLDTVQETMARGTVKVIDLFTSPLQSIRTLVTGGLADIWDAVRGQLKDITKSIKGFFAPITNLPKWMRETEVSLSKLAVGAVNATVRVGGVLQKLIDIEKLTTGLKAAGGLFGALFGPFGAIIGKVLSLFSPLVDMVVEGLMPAMETFTAIIKTSFNPLFELAELMAQMLAPMVQEFLEPFVELLEIIAVQAAAFVVSLVQGARSGGVLTSLFESLGPVVMDIFRALGGLGRELIPVVMKLFQELAPVAGDIIKEIAKLVAEILPEFGRIVAEVAPPLVKAFVELLRAIMPVLPPLVELAGVLIKDVFGPAVIAGAKWLSAWITNDVVPFIREWMPAVQEVLRDVARQVADFFSPGKFRKYTSDFYELFIRPITDWFGSLWEKVTAIKDAIAGFATSVGGRLLGVIGTGGVSVPALPDKGLADGAVVPPVPGGLPSIIGEGAAPEVVMPLTPGGVQAVMPTMLREAVELPGLDEVVTQLVAIRRHLERGAIKVKMDESGGAAPAEANKTSDMSEMMQLGAGLGLSGLG